MPEVVPYTLAGHELDSPLVATAGAINGTDADRILREVDDLARTGIGAITYGSVTMERREGNEATFGGPVYHHDSETGETRNILGLPNIGKDAAIALAPEIIKRTRDRGKLVIFSLYPTASEGSDSVEQARQMVYEFLQAGAELVEVNVSCPNIVTEDGGRKPILGYDVEGMHKLSEVLKAEVGEDQTLGLKVPPYVSAAEYFLVPEIAKVLKASKVFRFIVASNAIPGAQSKRSEPPLTVPGGSLSGPATKQIGREQLRMWDRQLEGKIDVMSALGVDSGRELFLRRRLGAAAAGGVTFLWESGNWPAKISTMLSEYADLAYGDT